MPKQAGVQKRTLETRKRLIESAKELFKTKGFYNTNTNEIARNAGISTGNFYNHFKDKMDIYIELSKEYFSYFYDFIDELIKLLNKYNSAAHLKLEKLINNYISLVLLDGDLFTNYHILMNDNTTLKKMHSELNSKLLKELTDFITDNPNIKPIDSPDEMAWILANLIVNIPLQISAAKSQAQRKKHIKSLSNLILIYMYK